MNKKSLIALSVSVAFAAGVISSDYKDSIPFFNTLNNGPAVHQYPDAVTAELEDILKQHQARLNPMLRPTVTGSYLAGRSAQKNKDWDNAYRYMNRAFELSDIGKADKNGILDRAFLMAITTADFDSALSYADKISDLREGGELAHILRAIKAFKDGDYQKSNATLAEIDTNVFGGYAVPLLKAWNSAAEGNTERAMSQLEASDFTDDNAYNFQKAIILDFTAQTQQADLAYRMSLQKGLPLQETLMVANFFERNHDWETAEKVYKLFNEQEPNNPYLETALQRVAAKEVPEAFFTKPDQGMAFTLYSMAQLLSDRDAKDSALIYNRIAEYVGHTNQEAFILMGDLMTENHHYDEAIAYYKKVLPTNVLYKTAQMKMVHAFEQADQPESALGILKNMQNNAHYVYEALVRTGDIHQSKNQFDLALVAYNNAVSKLGSDISADHWNVLYARGMAHEQMDNWPAAEKDFVKALELSPDNPALLNVLGYSWVDRGVNLERAMDMIEQAVQMRPHDGYIMDSYGWAFYKLEKYDEASYWLEKAIELHPEDATMNDHLGDAYWKSGRLKEARYQWERAGRFSDDTQLLGELSRKMKHGLYSEIETDSASVTEMEKPDAL